MKRRRKGALLLVVLSLLTLMLLLGLWFLVSAMQYQKAAKATSAASHAPSSAQAKRQMNSAMLQIVRGTRNESSPIYGHSLLEDLYGHEGFRCKVSSVDFIANGELARIHFDGPSRPNHAFDGGVITVRDKNDAYRSGRIVQFLGDSNQLSAAELGEVKTGDNLIINGYPFNADMETASREPDESWDAVDEFNLALASIPPAGSELPIVPSFHRADITLRPSLESHPGFASTNPRFDRQVGPWDVDNDGDGVDDSVWIDMGLPPMDFGNGRRYKPLIAALVVDMDGKLNVNAHGNLEQLALQNPAAVEERNAASGTRFGPGYPRGYGAGPAETDLRFLFEDFDAASEFLNSRYSSLRAPQSFAGFHQPGRQGEADATVGNQSLPARPFGTGYVYVDEMGQPVFVDQSPANENPYEVALLGRRFYDQTFDERDMEWLARSDYDSSRGKSRLEKWIRPDDTRLLTTASYSIPVLPKSGKQGLLETLRDRLQKNGITDSEIETQLNKMLPPEILRGEKMDLNRAFFHGEGFTRQAIAPGGIPRNLVPDNVRFTSDDEAQYAKGLYARHLYCIAMTLLPEPTGEDDARRLQARSIAQWAANVVDFRDPDGTHTPFEYDANPFDGWGTNGILKSKRLDENGDSLEEPSDPEIDVVWGMERPELLMTESLALHDRMVGDFEVGGYRKPKQPGQSADDDLDQIRRPRGPLLIELHSPHAHDDGTPRPIAQNAFMSQATEGLYYRMPKSNPVLNMDKIELGAHGLRYSVWRVAISEYHGRESEKEKWSPFQATSDDRSASKFSRCEPDQPWSMVDRTSPVLKSERLIWMASEQPEESHPDYGRTYFTETIPGFWPLKAQLPLGRTAVIAPFANFTIGHAERSDPPWTFYATRQRFVFAGGNDPLIEFETETGQVSRVPALSIMSTSGPIQTVAGRLSSVNVSATEPLPRDYGELYGVRPNVVRDQPCDAIQGAPMSVAESLRETHSEDNFKTAFLQRLANCAYGWNPESHHPMHDSRLPVNPYITVDWIPIKLSVFNSTLLPNEIGEWNSQTDGDFDHDDPKFDDANFRYDQALEFGTLEWNGKSEPTDPFSAKDTQATQLGNFWGIEARSNPHQATAATQRPPLRLGHTIGYVAEDATRSQESDKNANPRPWLAWSNHDFNNRFELLDVPKSSPARFRLEFGTSPQQDDGDSAKRFGHLLDFFDDETQLHKLFDFVHVPDNFVDAYRVTSTNGTTTRRSRFREPGKVNVNTISDPRVWSAIGGDHFANWKRVAESRATQAYSTNSSDPSRSSLWSRSAEDSKQPLLVPDTEHMHANMLRHSALYHQGWQKLGQTATTQSNVYAIWITMGFFELNPNYPTTDGQEDYSRPWHVDAQHPDGTRIGAEAVMRQGVSRHRSFYIVDRSLPVAFEVGANHNVRDAVKIERQLE